MKNIHTFLVKLALRLHSFSYKLVSFLAIKAENGLHPKHRLMDYHKFFLENVSATDSVLDIGCGNGALTFDVAKKVKKAIGIEIDPKPLAVAKGRPTLPNLTYICADATTYPWKDSFDAVILSNVLEHIENRVEFLKGVKKLAPKFLIRVPMFDREWVVPYKKELGLEYRLDTTHFTEFTKASFEREMREAGFTIKEFSVQWGEIWAVLSTI